VGHAPIARERWEQAFALFGGAVLIALVATVYVATWAHRAVQIAFYLCGTVLFGRVGVAATTATTAARQRRELARSPAFKTDPYHSLRTR
jgi:hypothetical protein